MKSLNISSPKELSKAIEDSSNFSGEELLLNIVPQTYSERLLYPEILDLSYKSDITINDKFRVLETKGFCLNESENIKIIGSYVKPSKEEDFQGYYEKQDNAAVFIQRSKNIHIVNMTYYGNSSCPISQDKPNGIALSQRGCSRVNILKSRFFNWRDAISIRDGSKNITIKNNEFRFIGRDAIGITNSELINITGNHIYDFCPNYTGLEAHELPKGHKNIAYLPIYYPEKCNPDINPNEDLGVSETPADHADCIQLTDCSKIQINHNSMGLRDWQTEETSDWSQSILIQFNPMKKHPDGEYVKIIGNKIRNRHIHGIYVRGYDLNTVITQENRLSMGASHSYCYRNQSISEPKITILP